MPIYEYKCEHCNQKYEALVKNINLTDDIGCPVCKSTKKKKLFSAFTATVSNGMSTSQNSCAGGNCNFDSAPSCSSGFCGLN